MLFRSSAAITLTWAVSGLWFGFSAEWQAVISTIASVTTLVMVFLIQATQNRDTVAMQVKLDELILATGRAHKQVIAAETLSEEELAGLRERLLSASGREDAPAAPQERSGESDGTRTRDLRRDRPAL